MRSGSIGLLALGVFAFLAFPSALQTAGAGLDASWIWGLNLARAQGAIFGRDVVFTYGPLGYLLRPLDIGGHADQALWLRGLQHLAILSAAGAVLVRIGRATPVVLFTLAALHLTALNTEPDYRQLFVIMLLSSVSLELGIGALIAALFVPAALMLFMKFSSGILAVLIVGAAGALWAWKHRSWRVPIAGGVLYGLTVAASGVLLFGSLDGLARFLGLALEVAAGYNASMFNGGPRLHVVAGVVAIAAAYLAAAWLVIRSSAARFPFLLLALPLPIVFKHAFLRHDAGHIPFVFEAVLAASTVGLLLARTAREQIVLLLASVGLTATLLLCWPEWERAAYVRAFKSRLTGHSALKALSFVFHPQEARDQARAATLRGLDSDHLPDDWRADLQGAASVMVVPSEIALCPANRLSCVPYPTLQMYTTYTPRLDVWTAERLRERPPAFVLASVDAIDGRQMLWDCPETWRAFLEGWKVKRLASEGNGRLLLEQRSPSRSLSAHPLGESLESIGRWVPVPHPSAWLRAHLHVKERWTLRLRRLLFRPRALMMEVRRTSGAIESFRVVTATLPSGLWIQGAAHLAPELAGWFAGDAPKDPIVALRLTGPAAPDFEPDYRLSWTYLTDGAASER